MHTTEQRRPNSFLLPASFTFFFKPKMMIIIALLLSWNLRNSVSLAMFHQYPPVGDGLPYHPHQTGHHHRTSSNVRMRAPASFNQLSQFPESMMPALGGAGITLSDETALQIRSSIPLASSAQIEDGMGLSGPKKKKNCGEPSIATRGLIGPTLKRSFFALTQDEVDQKIRDDEYREQKDRKKRDLQTQILQKRSGTTTGGEAQEIALPWTCETKYEWKDMGADHYPRFVRTAECKSRLCFNGFFRCRPRRYKTKVLKRVNPSDSTSCEDDDVSLPETLRSNWKFITVTINLCCDCTGRIPGNTEV